MMFVRFCIESTVALSGKQNYRPKFAFSALLKDPEDYPSPVHASHVTDAHATHAPAAASASTIALPAGLSRSRTATRLNQSGACGTTSPA